MGGRPHFQSNQESNMKTGRKSVVAALAGASTSAIATFAILSLPTVAAADPILTATTLGTPTDNAGHTASGYTAYMLTLTADTGQVIGGIDAGHNVGSQYGIYAQLLQDWTPSPTLISTDASGGALGLDSHFDLQPGTFVTLAPTFPPFEDSNQTAPAGSTLVNSSNNIYGTGTYLRGVFGMTAPQHTLDFAYIVLPSAATASFSLAVAEEVPGHPATGSVIVQSVPSPNVPHNLVYNNAVLYQAPDSYVNLITAGNGPNMATFSPGGSGNKINVAAAGATGFANNIGGTGTNGQAELYLDTVFPSTTVNDIFALNLKVNGADPTAAQIDQIVNDINSNNFGIGVASAMTPAMAALFPGYDLLLTSPGNGEHYFAIDLNKETTVAGATVTDVGATATVPEPASATGIGLFIAAGLIRRRRR
jgi:hypothetical protein